MLSSASSLILFSILIMSPASLAFDFNDFGQKTLDKAGNALGEAVNTALDYNCGLSDCSSGEWCCEIFGSLVSYCSSEWKDDTCKFYIFPDAIGLSRNVIIGISVAIGVVIIASIAACCCCCCRN